MRLLYVTWCHICCTLVSTICVSWNRESTVLMPYQHFSEQQRMERSVLLLV
jgi:hypothetical protein